MTADWIVVGSGFTGATAARVLAERGLRVVVLERRANVGGNAFDERTADGVYLHKYGPHLFHTSSERVVKFVTRFASWRPYNHRVLGEHEELRYPLPPNFVLVDLLTGRSSRAVQEVLLATYGAGTRVPLHVLEHHESLDVRDLAGRIREMVFTPYTRKMWGEHAAELLASTEARVPFVVGYDEGYFTDSFQAIPADGYSEFFNRVLDHPRIAVETNHPVGLAALPTAQPVIFTGGLDELLENRLGSLPYRSIRFREHVTSERLPHAATLNFNDGRPQTRVTDMGFTACSKVLSTVWVEETPEPFRPGANEALYPIPAARWRDVHNKYVALLGDSHPNVVVAGRMGRYQYYDMDQACATALRIGSQA